ncbi:MAG: LemA family protein [Candidatus Micrarchaeota archaeon]
MVEKKWIIIGAAAVLAVIAIVLVLSVISTYNKMVSLDQTADAQWANVESAYQRRLDLIPNLVETAKGYMTHESEVFIAIAEARAKLAGAKTTNEKVKATGELEGALSRLLVIVENYPELKAVEQFNMLSAELAGTENRINVERNRYNDDARAYNTAIKTFPGMLFAGTFGFEERSYFEAEKGAEKAPTVEFD